MFVVVSKVLGPLASPLGLCFCVWVASAWIYWRRSRVWGNRMAIAGIVILLAFSNFQVGGRLMHALENDYVALEAAACPAAEAIVVLGGMTAPPIPPRPTTDVADSFDRLLHALRLWKAGKAPLLIVSGGNMSFLTGSDLTEARRMQALAQEYGVPASAIILEERSRNTFENALYVREVLEERGLKKILLVTSASHMPRSAAVFRTQGIDFVAAPTDVRVVPRPFNLFQILPNFEALKFSTIATKEYVGIAVYRLKGWIE